MMPRIRGKVWLVGSFHDCRGESMLDPFLPVVKSIEMVLEYVALFGNGFAFG